MNRLEFLKNDLLRAFNETVQTRQNADIILETVGFPRGGRPQFPDADDRTDYWMRICLDIDSGILEEGTDLQVLVDAAAQRYPSNSTFRRFRTAPREPVPSPVAVANGVHRFFNLLIEGWEDQSTLIDEARRLAVALGMPPESITLGFASAEGLLVRLEGWSPESAMRLGRVLRESAPIGHNVQTSVAAADFEDYLIGRLYVEGPDQRRFEVNDVPASTLVRDVAQGVFAPAYYDKETTAGGEAAVRREVVVDRQNPDGSSNRLDPDKTLHDERIKENDVLNVSPESTAGAVNPLTREAALVRAREEVLSFAENHPGFEVFDNSPYAPTEYIFKFRVPSFAVPDSPGSPPRSIDRHEVFLFLPADFPMLAPQVYWQTPIFHPNIHAENGIVCLGALADRYRPGLSFATLCQLLIDIAGYRNYAAGDGINLEAQKWAVTPQGQLAIEGCGGKSVTRMFLHTLHKPRRLWIRPLENESTAGSSPSEGTV